MLIITCNNHSAEAVREFDRIKNNLATGVVIAPYGGAQNRPPMKVEHIADGTGQKTVLWDETK